MAWPTWPGTALRRVKRKPRPGRARFRDIAPLDAPAPIPTRARRGLPPPCGPAASCAQTRPVGRGGSVRWMPRADPAGHACDSSHPGWDLRKAVASTDDSQCAAGAKQAGHQVDRTCGSVTRSPGRPAAEEETSRWPGGICPACIGPRKHSGNGVQGGRLRTGRSASTLQL